MQRSSFVHTMAWYVLTVGGLLLAGSLPAEGGWQQQARLMESDGYAVKNDSFPELLEAIRCVAAGGRYLSPRLAGSQAMVEAWQRRLPQHSDIGAAGRLTERELQVISLVASGLEKREIAVRLGISARTVDAHRANIAEKTGMRRIAELTRFAVRRNLV